MVRKGDHEAVDELLPWFVNGSLGDREEHRVLTHLRECAECRAERDRLQDVQQFVVLDDESDGPDYRFAFSKLMNRIDAHEANLESARDFRQPPTSQDRGLRRAAPYLAAAACLVASLAFVITMNPAAPGGGEFETLTRTTAISGEEAPRRLALTFEDPGRADVVRSALIETRSNIVAGPIDGDTWIVEIEVPAAVSPEQFIESIRSVDGVRHAAFEAEAPGTSP